MGSAEMRKVFENKHSAVSIQPNMKAFATLCRLDSKNGKSRLKLSRLGLLKKHEKWLRPSGRPLGRIGVELLFSTKRLWGVGRWLRDAGRGLQRSGDRDICDRKHRSGPKPNFWHRVSSPSQETLRVGMKTTTWVARSPSASGTSLLCLCSSSRKARRPGRRGSDTGLHWNISWPAGACCWKSQA
jgi:hypothetical protein